MFDNFKIRTLVVGALAVLLSLMLAIGLMGMRGASHSVALVKSVTLADQASRADRSAIRLDMELARSQILQALQHNPTLAWSQLHDHPLTVHFDQIDKLAADTSARWEKYIAKVSDPDEKQLAQAWYAKSDNLGTAHILAAAKAIKDDNWDEAETVLIKKINPSYRVGDEALKAFTAAAEANASNNEANVEASLGRTAWIMGTLVLVSVLVGIVVGYALIHSISAPLSEATAALTALRDRQVAGKLVLTLGP